MAVRRIGIDTGGTFTDVATLGRDGLAVHKLPSTPHDPAEAVIDGLSAVRRPGDTVDVVHGTTVALNAVLTGNLARTAFVTNKGFEDLIEIGRQDRTDLYDLTAQKPQIPVPRRLRYGVASRRDADGRRLLRPTRTELAELRRKLAAARVESVAIGLLHSYATPEDEHEIARALRTLGVPVTCSADLLRAPGEFERFTACILNAATHPKISTYLASLREPVRPGELRLMRSSGGIMSAREAAEYPARAMFSGPAGGVIATRALARRAGYRDVAALDMGGTSTDVCLVRPEASVSDSAIAGLPLAIPAVEVHTVGCGGGSIARVDAGGALRVGPQSAGADPGPACYGVGDDPTVTDAHMVLGHMGADTLLGGNFPIDPDRSMRAVGKLAKKLGLDERKTAEGILQVAEIRMMRALLVITVRRAMDPARVPLVAYGGAGGLHAEGLRRLLDMPAAVVPEHPGAFSAIGLALAGESAEHTIPVLQPLQSLSAKELRRRLGEVSDLARLSLPDARVRVRLSAGLRYAGQGRALTVPVRFPLDRTTARAHEELFGFVPVGRPLELVELTARAEVRPRSLPVELTRGSGSRGGPAARPRTRRKPLVGGPSWRVFHREDLRSGGFLDGPCIVEEGTGATVIPAGTTCELRPYGLELRPR